MSDLKKQKEKTDGKGWGAVNFSRESPYKAVKDIFVGRVKEDIEQVKTKAKNIWGGVKVVAKKLKGKD